jgi:hypothetical protein
MSSQCKADLSPQGIFSALSLREDIATTMILPIVMAIKKPPEGGLMVYPL